MSRPARCLCGSHPYFDPCGVGCKICPIHGGGDARVTLDQLQDWAHSDSAALAWGDATDGSERLDWTLNTVFDAIRRGVVRL